MRAATVNLFEELHTHMRGMADESVRHDSIVRDTLLSLPPPFHTHMHRHTHTHVPAVDFVEELHPHKSVVNNCVAVVARAILECIHKFINNEKLTITTNDGVVVQGTVES